MRLLLPALLLLAQATPDDAPLVAPQVDSAVRSIAGYNGQKEARPVADDVFLRRVMKDLVDAAPTEAETKAFVDSADAHKRSRKINELLADERYGKFWARRYSEVFFGDLNRIRWIELPQLPPGREVALIGTFTDWFALKLNKDLPWTEIVANMLDSRGTTEVSPDLAYLLSLRRGKGYTREFAEQVPRHFLGIRLACARCHDHPYEKWTDTDYYGMAAFVVRQRARVYRDQVEAKYAAEGEMRKEAGGLPVPTTLREGEEVAPKFLFGGSPEKNDDRMKSLIGFMTNRTTVQLPRMLVNRTWGWLFGYGIVQPVDDFNLRNKPISPTLLELLARNVVDNKYSLKQLLRVICNTQAYQMPMPDEAREASSFRHLAKRREDQKPDRPLAPKPPALPVVFEAPEPWTRVTSMAGVKALYLVPHREDKARTAELALYEAKFDAANPRTGRIDPSKSTVQNLKGKDGTKIALTEISGTAWCRPEADGPVDYRLWVAVVEAPKPLYFRVAGAADLLDPWRADFISLLQSLSLK